jgi:hypothetical protein
MLFIGNGRRRLRPSTPFESEPKPEVGTFHKKMFANLDIFVPWVIEHIRKGHLSDMVLILYLYIIQNI